jgi:tetratricopeptide (TPR) repeat protein
LKQRFPLFLLLLLAGHAFCQQDQPSDLASVLAAAQQAQAANNYAAAAADYKEAVKLRPDIPELRANLGLMQHEAGDYPDAIRSFQEALRLKPSLYVPNLFLGIDYVHTGRAKEAVPLLMKAEKMNATDALSSLTLGRAWSSLGDYGAAIREFRRAIRIDAKQSSAWFGLGIAQLDEVEEDARTMTDKHADTSYAKALYAESLTKQSRYKEAADLYKSILAATDQPPCTLSEAGFVSLKQGDIQNAKQQFTADRDRHPECSLAMLGEARVAIEAGKDEDALQLIRQVWTRDHGFLTTNASLLFDGMPSESSQRFLSFLAQQQSSGQIDQDLGAALTQSGEESADAGDEMRAASSSSAVSAAGTQARQEYIAGHYGLCSRSLKNNLQSTDAATLQLLAVCSFFAGDYDLTSEASRTLPSTSSYPQAEALYWSIKANEKLAFESLAHFEQLEPNSARSHILLGDIYRQRERYDDAIKEYAKALALSPEDTAALLGLASAYYGVENTAKAIDTARQALLGSPDDPEINLLMGEALLTEHQFTDSEPYLLKALHAKPQMLAHVHALLGAAYAGDGKTQDAIRELKLGASSDEDGSAHYHLARLYSKIGDSADAAVALQQMKVLQQRRREGAVTALEDSRYTGLDDAP